MNRSILIVAILLLSATLLCAQEKPGLDQVSLIGTYAGMGEVRRGEVIFHVIVENERRAVHFWVVARKHQANLILNAKKGDMVCIAGHHEQRTIEPVGVRLVIFAEKMIIFPADR